MCAVCAAILAGVIDDGRTTHLFSKPLCSPLHSSQMLVCRSSTPLSDNHSNTTMTEANGRVTSISYEVIDAKRGTTTPERVHLGKRRELTDERRGAVATGRRPIKQVG